MKLVFSTKPLFIFPKYGPQHRRDEARHGSGDQPEYTESAERSENYESARDIRKAGNNAGNSEPEAR